MAEKEPSYESNRSTKNHLSSESMLLSLVGSPAPAPADSNHTSTLAFIPSKNHRRVIMGSNGSGDDEIMLTLVNAETGESESIPFPTSTSLSQVVELCQAIFNLASIELRKEGRPISNHGLSLSEAGLVNGDVLAVQPSRRGGGAAAATAPSGSSSSSSAAAAPSGGLDFSNLLAAAGASSSSTGTAGGASRSGGGLDFGNLLTNMSGGGAGASPPPPVYYKGMNLQEATGYNPHPETFVRFRVLRSRCALPVTEDSHNAGFYFSLFLMLFHVSSL
jgi:hypothetical protein